jgi:hypothetical protein
VVRFSGAPSVAVLPDASAPWPDSSQAGAPYHFVGYSVDEGGRPTFRYRVGAVEVEETLSPSGEGTTLRHELRLRAPEGTAGVYVRLADGATLEGPSSRAYAVDDARYYVATVAGTPNPVIRAAGERQELLVPVRFRGGEANVVSEIVW